jgi:lysophospholipid acyltransferase
MLTVYCVWIDSIIYFQAFGPVERCKYYAIWTLTEGASILTGLGFTGFGPHGEAHWNGAANVKVFTIEFPPNFKVLLDSWNMKTNVWLRECVYKRVTPKGKKPGFASSMITFFTSAFWVSFLLLLSHHFTNTNRGISPPSF